MWWIPVLLWAMVFLMVWGAYGLSVVRSNYYSRLEAAKYTNETPPIKTRLVKFTDYICNWFCKHK